MAWPTTTITLDDGTQVAAKLPVIVSVSRATDIPAFFPDWLMRQLRRGYTKWKNPYNGRSYWYSFAQTRVLVFWTKNPAPLLPYLPEIEALGYSYYFQYTLNNYQPEGYEPGLPPLEERIASFLALSRRIGARRMVWRFDPLFLTRSVTIASLLQRIKYMGDALYGATNRLTFSFADIEKYRKVKRNLQKSNIPYRLWTPEAMQEMAEALGRLNERWGLELTTCAEPGDYRAAGVQAGKCVDDGLMASAFPGDEPLMQFLGRNGQQGLWGRNKKAPKDAGQRNACGCVQSKDIGFYNTCRHGCVYCYANRY